MTDIEFKKIQHVTHLLIGFSKHAVECGYNEEELFAATHTILFMLGIPLSQIQTPSQ